LKGIWISSVAVLLGGWTSAQAQTPAALPHSSLPPTGFVASPNGPCSGPGCAPQCCAPERGSSKPECGACDDGTQFWFRGEYLFAWVRGAQLPPLLATSPAGTSQALVPANSTVAFGDERVNDGLRSGFRVRAGGYLDESRRCAIELRFFFLESQSDGGSVGVPPDAAGGAGGLIASRPFINALNGALAAELVTFPGLLAGDATVDASSSNFYGGDAVFRKTLCCSCPDDCDAPGYRVDFLAGYRFLYFDDGVSITERLAPLAPQFLPGTRIVLRDDFTANNQFHGGVVGLFAECCRGPWLFEVSPRVSVGQTSRQVKINGFTAVTAPGAAPSLRQGGLLAQSSNIGRHQFNEVGFVPEVDVAVGYRVSQNLRLYAGYTFLYWPEVARAGEQIDLVVNPNLIPGSLAGPVAGPVAGPARPAVLRNTSDVWVQAITLGAELRF
jgi:hypothetical protein